MTLHREAEPESDTPGTADTAPDAGTGRPVALAPEFPVLDTLRFVGALAVLTTHVSFQSGSYTQHGVWGALLSRLDVGVAIFFVLSGFLLFRPHVAAAAVQRRGPRLGRYYWKRFLRIYPVYAVAVVVALLTISDNDGVGLRGWLRTLLMLDSFTAPHLPQGLTQMWSLAVEVCFYLVLPALAALAFGRHRHRLHTGRFVVLVTAMLVTSVVWHAWAGPQVSTVSPGTPMTWLPAYLTWFAVGMGLALVQVRAQEGARDRATRLLSVLGEMPGACWAAVAGLMLVAATPVAGPTLLFVPTSAESLTKHLLYAVIGGLVVVTGVFTAGGSRYAQLMSHPVLRHLGHISYGVFCVHLVVLHAVMAVGDFELFRGHTLEILGSTLLISLAASEVVYRLVERPTQRLRGLSWRRSRRGSQPRASAQAPTTRS